MICKLYLGVAASSMRSHYERARLAGHVLPDRATLGLRVAHSIDAIVHRCHDGQVIVDWTREFDRWWSHVQSLAEARPDPTNARVFRLTVAQIQYLQDLSAEPLEETPTLRRVVRSSQYPLWRVSHPYEPGIAVRLIVWFPPEHDAVVVVALGVNKAKMGDVFYDGAGRRADAAIDEWIAETEESP
jgi:hypothetical protein